MRWQSTSRADCAVPHARGILYLTVALAPLLCPGVSASADLSVRDYIGREWTNECVEFAATPEQGRAAEQNRSLVDSTGRAVPYQLVQGDNPQTRRLACLVNLAPFTTQSFRFADGQTPPPASDLRLEETADEIRMVNRFTGIAVAKQLTSGKGPLAGFRLPSGKWSCASRLASPQPVTKYSARVTARGSVFIELVCRAEFGAQDFWQVKFRLQAQEPVVLIEEHSSVGKSAVWQVVLDRDFSPDSILFRTGKGQIGLNRTEPIAPGPVHTLEAWLHWWENDRQGHSFGLYNSREPDLLAVGAYRADAWVDLAIPEAERLPLRVPVVKDQAGLHMDLPLKRGSRHWLLMALKKADCLAVLQEKNPTQCSLPAQYVIKHGHFPLNRVREQIVTWDGARQDTHPRLYLAPRDLQRWRQTADRSKLSTQVPSQPLNQFNMEGPLAAWLVTGNPELGRFVAEQALRAMQDSIDMLVKQDGIPFGCAPHHLQVISDAMSLADAALADEHLPAATRERLLAQAAFLGYTIDRPDFWSEERRFSANPNMTTSVYGYKATIACLIPSHPLARRWVQDALKQLKGQLDDWADANGGWLEAPHYAMVSFDQILGVFVMAHHAGFADYLFDPKLKTVADWFGKISTPPDSRIGGSRHLPPIGNTYLQEPTGEFAHLAYLWRDKDPEFSARMQWLYRQHGSFKTPGIGGGYPAFAGYRALLRDESLPARAPTWKSELFPETGAILRNAFPSERETQLHLVLGRNHAHYDYDSGALTLWGKGRVLADDFGYYGRAPLEDHNLIESPVAGNGGEVKATGFAATASADYVRVELADWTRQILFVKDADPLAANYFVINDQLATAAPATWRLWSPAEKVTLGTQNAVVAGKEDVDLEVFFARPAAVRLRTEDKTRRSGSGLFANGSTGPMESTQRGVIATVERDTGFWAVLYPRLKTERAPAFTSLAAGRGVKVQHAQGTDYVFLSTIPFTHQVDDVVFEGTVGMIQLRGSQPALFAGPRSRVSARGQELKTP